ncbi:unnamed protein product [Acanthoscelides obtectus]|uniref:TPPP family protein n=1 Tax=Acanthoscelides obtectus TaxID=200917 RepID=A0A9P0LXE0_ACAOB|nr:unnamed protein product [Acanthoscelides obtectus]CAK1626051.1 TPPP family protein CG45057 [Acanthoscelides obtectus]
MAGSTKLDQQFIYFAKFGSEKADGKTITIIQIDKWFKQAELFDRRLTMTDTGVLFNEFESRTITYPQFLIFLDKLNKQKKIPLDVIKEKLQTCGLPGVTKKKEQDKDKEQENKES